MKRNMGIADRSIRLLISTIIAILFFTLPVTLTTAVILIIMGGVFLVTSITGFCLLYDLLGLNTSAAKK